MSRLVLALVPYVLRVRDEHTPPKAGEEHLERPSRTLMLGATEVPLHVPVLGLAEEVVQVANDGQRGVWVGGTAGVSVCVDGTALTDCATRRPPNRQGRRGGSGRGCRTASSLNRRRASLMSLRNDNAQGNTGLNTTIRYPAETGDGVATGIVTAYIRGVGTGAGDHLTAHNSRVIFRQALCLTMENRVGSHCSCAAVL